MNMLIDEVQMLAGSLETWIVVGVMAMVAVQSLATMFMCPYVHGKKEFSEEQIVDAQSRRFIAGPRFAMAMVAGIVMLLTGLFMIAGGLKPTLALALLVIGIVIVQTEPVRLRIRESMLRVVAMQARGGAAAETARLRLRGDHQNLVFMNIAIVLCLITALLAF